MEKANSVIDAAIPKDSIVLVTGVSGYIASHCADQFLEAGYRVRGTVRSQDKAEWLYSYFDGKYGKGRFEAVVVADMAGESAFDEAVKGVSGICHTASILTFSDKAEEVIPPTVRGTLNILTSATKEPAVKSIVYTSSSSSALVPKPNTRAKITKNTWNDEAVEKSTTEPTPMIVYSASKTQAERALWTAVNATQPPFQVAAVLPNTVFGPVIRADKQSASTAGILRQVYQGDTAMMDMIGPQWFVDVRDVARLHVVAMIDPVCKGERVFAFSEPFNWNDVLAVFRSQHPGKEFLPDQEGLGRDLYDIPNADAKALLEKHYGKEFTGLDESVRATTESFV